MKIIIAPDKFKGSLTSLEACVAIRDGILEFDKNIEVLLFPMADGGDGFAEVLKYYLGTVSQPVASVDPLGRRISSSYEWRGEDRTAIIEVASCSGLVMLSKEERNPLITSTYGTGIEIKHAIENGANKIILGVGGSSTNDAGMGILCALGFSFYDADDNPLHPCGESLLHVRKISPPPSLPPVPFVVACDVNNPLHGPDGAACIFAPQKGANPEQVELLDKGLKQFAGIIKQHTGRDVSTFHGAGAAGGIPAGLKAYLNVDLIEGTKLIIEASAIKKVLQDADIIVTGEGKLDQQSFMGKAIAAMTSIARERNIPVVGVCGKLELSEPEWKKLGLSLATEINNGSENEEESMKNASIFLKEKSRLMMSLLRKLVVSGKH